MQLKALEHTRMHTPMLGRDLVLVFLDGWLFLFQHHLFSPFFYGVVISPPSCFKPPFICESISKLSVKFN